jgi:predicted Zn-dependent protease
MGPFDYRSSNAPSRGGGFGRLLIALGIALFAWISYSSHTEENPVTGEKQHIALSPQQEIRLGLESAPTMSKQMGGELPDSDHRTQEVKTLGNFLISHTLAKNSPWQFQFHLLADPKTVNAFALPGGQIFITEGLYSKLQNEAQLAGVLSHEMGHVIERHSAAQMAKSQLGQSLVLAVGAATSDRSNAPFMAAAVVNQMLQLRYSRHDESQADEWGIKLMSQAGYDPEQMIEVMRVLKAVAGSAGGATLEIFQTHPNPDLRIQQIQEYLEKHKDEIPKNLSKGKALPTNS